MKYKISFDLWTGMKYCRHFYFSPSILQTIEYEPTKCYAKLPVLHHRSRNQTSYHSFVHQMGTTQHLSRKKTCRWREESTWHLHCTWAQPLSSAGLRICHLHCKYVYFNIQNILIGLEKLTCCKAQCPATKYARWEHRESLLLHTHWDSTSACSHSNSKVVK